MVRAVLLDLDDTLFDHRACSRLALEAARACHPSLAAMPALELERIHAEVLEDLHEEVMLGRTPLEQARRERFRRLLAAAGTPVDEAAAAAAAAAYRDRYRDVRRPVPGAVALLAALGAEARVGILSNNLYEEQMDKLRVCGLDRFVEALIVSERVGVAKPAPAIFREAVAQLGSTPEETVMVGDSWRADIAGGRAAGLQVVWYNPLRRPAPPDELPAPELHALEPVEAAVRLILSPQPPTTVSS